MWGTVYLKSSIIVFYMRKQTEGFNDSYNLGLYPLPNFIPACQLLLSALPLLVDHAGTGMELDTIDLLVQIWKGSWLGMQEGMSA